GFENEAKRTGEIAKGFFVGGAEGVSSFFVEELSDSEDGAGPVIDGQGEDVTGFKAGGLVDGGVKQRMVRGVRNIHDLASASDFSSNALVLRDDDLERFATF